MVQEFYILRCSACNFFQVQIVKKAKTWICKMCNFKQSVIKVFGQGTAKECRLHVQKLNLMTRNKQEIVDEANFNEPDPSDEIDCQDFYPEQTFREDSPSISADINVKKSKWSKYLDEEEYSEETQTTKKRKGNFDPASMAEDEFSKSNITQNSYFDQCTKNEKEIIPLVEFSINACESSQPISYKVPTMNKFNLPFNNISAPTDTERDDSGCSRILQKRKIQVSDKNHPNDKTSGSNVKICSSKLFSTFQKVEDIDAILDL